MAELVYLVVYGGVLFDVAVGAGNISLRLVVVIVGHEVLHGILGEEFAELRAELCRKYLVVCKDESGLVHTGDDIRHGEGLSRTCDAEEYLLLFARLQAAYELVDSLRLVACGSIV